MFFMPDAIAEIENLPDVKDFRNRQTGTKRLFAAADGARGTFSGNAELYGVALYRIPMILKSHHDS